MRGIRLLRLRFGLRLYGTRRFRDRHVQRWRFEIADRRRLLIAGIVCEFRRGCSFGREAFAIAPVAPAASAPAPAAALAIPARRFGRVHAGRADRFSVESALVALLRGRNLHVAVGRQGRDRALIGDRLASVSAAAPAPAPAASATGAALLLLLALSRCFLRSR